MCLREVPDWQIGGRQMKKRAEEVMRIYSAGSQPQAQMSQTSTIEISREHHAGLPVRRASVKKVSEVIRLQLH